MRRLLSRLGRPASFALLPLSIVPFLLSVPVISGSHASFQRAYKSGPLPAPKATITPAQLGRFAPLPATPGAVPVLAYGAVNGSRETESVTRRAFADQLRLLRHLGYQTIGMGQYARFRRGDTSGLPARPVLVTFNGGRLDAYRGVDRILRREHQRATMFVVGGAMTAGDRDHLMWSELHRMVRSGRWDVQPQAVDAQSRVYVDDHGAMAPFLTARRFLASTGRESVADYEQRVARELFDVRDMMRNQGLPVHALAVPYGDVGTDPQLRPLLTGLLTRQFATYFVGADADGTDFSTPGRGAAERFPVHADTTLDDLYAWLRAGTEEPS